MVKSNINSLMNKSEESQQKIAMLKEDLKDSMINLEKYEVINLLLYLTLNRSTKNPRRP